MTKVVLGLGSNIGDRNVYLQQVIDIFKPIKQSDIYETEAILPDNSPEEWNIPYLNMAILVETNKKPFKLLKYIKDIEKKLGRIDRGGWGPREIDIDILLYDDFVLNTEILTIPHKEIQNRPFVIKSIKEVLPDWKIKIS